MHRTRGPSNGSGSETSPEDVNADEYNVLYIGHSFGRRFAESLEDYAHVAGFEDHAQYIEFSGGESGSPGLLWEDRAHRANIKAYLDTGEIDVLVMICCSPEFIQTLDTDQAVWNFTDYAVAQNPDVRIGLAMPWKDFPSSFENASEYAANSTLDLYPYWVNLSQNLSTDYPGTEVFTFHHGALASELRDMFEAGELEGDVTKLQGNKATSIFTDDKGHAGSIWKMQGPSFGWPPCTAWNRRTTLNSMDGKRICASSLSTSGTITRPPEMYPRPNSREQNRAKRGAVVCFSASRKVNG